MTIPRRRPGGPRTAAPDAGQHSYPSYAPRREEPSGARGADRKEAEIRRMLDAPHPPVPPDLAERAMARGRRIIRRRRARRAIGWLLLLAAVVAAVVAVVAYLHGTGSGEVTPPFGD